MAEQTTCPICEEKVTVDPYEGGSYKLNCVRCGRFSVSKLALNPLSTDVHFNRANLSGWIRENQGYQITENNLHSLLQIKSPAVGVKGEKLLLWFAKTNPKAGTKIRIVTESFTGPVGVRLSGMDASRLKYLIKPELLACSWAQDFQEFFYILEQYLENEVGQIEFRGSDYRITPRGWAHLQSLQQTNAQSQIGFVAMWFDKSVDPAWTAIDAGIRSSGYEPLRIDRKEHNNKIDDEIIAGIRRSKFLVADFTGHRGGVYFETGFATGLGLPVIWLCRQDELEKTHFDTRQYNFIVWEADKLSELEKVLQNRIEATIGRGPLTANVVT